MLKHKSLWLIGCLFSVAVLSACSNDKVLPKGTRISILDQMSTVKPDVAPEDIKISIPEASAVGEWLQTDMNAQHKSTNLQASAAFVKVWSAGFGKGNSKRDFLISKPLVKGQVVYTLDATGVLTAFNLEDGEKIWSEKLMAKNKYTGDTAVKGVGLAMEGYVIYVTTGFGVVVAATAEDGSKVWEQDLKAPLRIAPMVAADKVFVQSVDNKFYALIYNEKPIIYLYSPIRITAIRKKFKNVFPTPLGGLIHNLEEIYIEEGN